MSNENDESINDSQIRLLRENPNNSMTKSRNISNMTPINKQLGMMNSTLGQLRAKSF